MSRRSHARAAKIASRAAVASPCPPGQIGGCYQPLQSSEITTIYTSALRILAEIGMAEAPPVVVEKAIAQGAYRNELGRLCYPTALVEDIIAQAAKSFVFYGRDSRHDFELGGERVYFGTGGAAVQTLDLDSGLYRPSTLQDLYDFTRLIDTLDNISWFTRCCVATDVPDIYELDINTAYALLAGTTKPIGTSFTLAQHVDPIIDLFDIALGGQDKFRQRPFCKAHISPVISPLRYGEDAVAVTVACIRRGVPINCIIAAQSGATAPATLAGMLAQSTAETLAGLILVNLLAPAYPMIFSNWPLVIDLRTGAFAGGSGEIALLNAAAAQITNFLGLPSGVACSMSDAKAPDAQMGTEKALTALATGLAGGNMIYESSGMMASLLGASFEAFIMDDEMLSHVYRILRGIEVSDETIGLDAIRKAVTGEGHFLSSRHTMAAMQRDYFYPQLADRDEPKTWAENGALTLHARANAKAKAILATHYPHYLSTAADQKIRKHYPILLNKTI